MKPSSDQDSIKEFLLLAEREAGLCVSHQSEHPKMKDHGLYFKSPPEQFSSRKQSVSAPEFIMLTTTGNRNLLSSSEDHFAAMPQASDRRKRKRKWSSGL